ncbi:hypothetical protein C8R44DRAFT_763116 [Mycena epipterygia]|nr:hypothetical protein C8R44DRAFT_763116 [Mycena epipterygia]
MAETMEPPSYDGYGFESLVASSHGSDLPAYTRRPTPPPRAAPVERELKKFPYEIKTRGGLAWATFLIHGDPRLTKAMPTIMEGSNLVGSVTLNLQTVETIQAICILIKGDIVSGSIPLTRTSFLEVKHTVWSAADENTGKNSAGKLRGDYSWPFSIPLPGTVGKDGKTYRLPHTFNQDRLASFSVQYTAELRIVRGKLRTDDKALCVFGFFSMCQPDPASQLRQLAYQENSPLFGPEADPEGWHTEMFSAKGTIFASRMVDIKCMFSLAKPLSYTRSASIPCAITIESTDLQALDLLSSPSSSIVYLERVTQENSETWRNTHEPCGQAVFWPSTEGSPADSPHRRQLMGEIHLKATLQPSSAVFGFAVEYTIIVFPFQAAGFKPLDNDPVLRQVVEITTRYAPGPRQKTYSPPTFETRNPVVDHYYYSMVVEGAGARRTGRRG